MSMIFYVFTGVLLALLMYNIGIPMILRLPNNINTMLLNYRMRKWEDKIKTFYHTFVAYGEI